jgi:hypothetical protein
MNGNGKDLVFAIPKNINYGIAIEGTDRLVGAVYSCPGRVG